MFSLRYRIFTGIALSSILFGIIITGNPTDLFTQIIDVVTHHGLLVSDLMAIGLGGSMINAGLIVLIVLGIMRFLKTEINGLEIAGLLTVFGFAFFGKTLFAVWPPFMGVLLMAYLQKKPLKSVLPVAMFATAAAPAVAIMLYTFASYGSVIAFLISISVGIIVGMSVQLMAPQVKKYHDGLILYNVGFTLGFVLLFFFSILKAFGFELSAYSGELLSTNQNELILFVLLINLAFILYGYYVKQKDEQVLCVVKCSEICDCVSSYGYASTLINVGSLGLFSLAYVLVCGGDVNGPVMAGIFTVAGFAAFGKTFKNIIPIMIGATLMSFLAKGGANIATTSSIITALFATALAPISKRYGSFMGFLFGMAHFVVVANTGILHGYMSLYNNAFAMGLVVLILRPFADAYLNLRRRA